MMTRAHVKAMHSQSGFNVALRVLRERKAREEFFVQLRLLERERLAKDRRRDADSDGTLPQGIALRILFSP
jgi:hypothetical protein